MASRSHVESKFNSEVAERRLRPIYDCLDNGNNKKALQEADKALKKQKDFQCAKVLKALALLRLGRQDESSTLLEEVHKQHPTEDSTLNAMAICYREIHKLDLIADMYENANKSRPGNEEILTHLFMAYVRLGHYKKQQQTAMALHKVQPQKNPYCFWAIMSIVMQAQNSPDLAKKMFLPLAERMTKKFVDEDKIEAEAEVQMYLIILEHSEKYEEALEVLQGPLAAKLMSELDFKETKMAELFTRLKNWQKSNTAYKQLLCKNPDHIGWWKEYIRSTIELSRSTKDLDIMVNSEVEVDNTLENALSFIESCRSGLEDRYQCRGPFLAQLELIKQCQHAGIKWTEYGNPVALLDGYYEMFGDKYCCFSDIRTYLEILNESEQTKLAELLLSKNKYANADGSLIFVDNVKQMQRHITSLQLRQCLGCYGNLSSEEKRSLAHELVQRHTQGIHFGSELLTTDLQYCDSYLLLAVALLLDIMHTNGDRRLVWECIILLEQGLVHSPSSSQIKLLLIRLYCSVGAFGPCPNLYDSMEIKHIMNDTLGYIVSSHVGRLGHFMAACSVYGTMLRFFTVNHKETAEYLIASYKYGSFTKILEFVQFRERLQNSLQFASAGVERKLLDIILDTSSHSTTEQMVMYMEIDPANIKTCYDRLRDNRDLSVVLCWDPSSSYDMEALQQQSLKEELAWLKVRDLMLHILAGCVKLGQEIDHDHQTKNGIANEGPVPLHLMLSDLQTQLSNHIETCRQCYSQEIKYPIQGPFRTRLSTYLRGGYSSMFLEMHSNVLYVQSLSDIDLEKIEASKEESLKSKVPTIAEELMQKYPCVLLLEDGDRKSIDPMVLEHTVLLAESLSHMCVMVGVCYRLLKPVKTVLARRNKKKKDNPIPMPPTFENFNELVSGLERVCQCLHRSASSLDPVYLGLDLGTLSLAEHMPGDQEKDVAKEVWKKVEAGYQQSVLEITELLHKKLQYLGGLHL